MTNARNVKVVLVGLLTLLPAIANGQEFTPAPPQSAPPGYVQQGYAPQPGDPSALAPQMAQPAPPQPSYTPQQLEQLVAPIALYPDPLIAQILMASTYPLEIVEAQRWHQNPQNAALTGEQLQAALEQQPWDPSVKSLIAFPQVLSMLDNNLQWTEQLGDAFMASQPALMDSVQDLRHKAEAAGNLSSTPQQTVTQQQGEVIIEPANPEVVYVPYYNPTIVYGPWPYAAYPPYYFPPPPGYIYTNVGLFGFGVGFAVLDWAWGWNHWDWRHHEILVDERRFVDLNRGRSFQFAAGGAWAHDPEHRHGVPYHSAAVRQQFQSAATQARAGYRGYFNTPQGNTAANIHPASAAGATHASAFGGGSEPGTVRSFQSQTRASAPATGAPAASSAPRFTASPAAISHFGTTATQQHQFQQSAQRAQTRSAPMFESFSRGADVRTQAARGSYSRASMASVSHSAPAPQAHSSGGGGGGGGGRSGGGGGSSGGGGGHQDGRTH